MPNIKFNYLYRDAGNYKTYVSVVFMDRGNVCLTDLENSIRDKLVDGLWFYASEWGVPDMRNNIGDEDPTWHEFEGLEYTGKEADANINVGLLIAAGA